jgi:PAS domain S-box-containing protein
MKEVIFKEAVKNGNLRILLLEDDTDDAYLLQYRLRQHFGDCEFMVAMNSQKFRSALDTFQPQVVLAGDSLSGFNATDALQVVKKRSKDIAFIVITAAISEETAIRIINEGADDFILKESLFALPAVVDAALSKRRKLQQRQKALERLTLRVEKYKHLVEKISDGLLSLDKEWRIIYINPIAQLLLGGKRQISSGNIIWEEFPQTLSKPLYHAMQVAMREQQLVSIKEYSISANRWFEATLYPSEGGITVYFKDFTEEKIAAEAARKSEEKYRKFIERITGAFISLDQHWHYTYANQKAAGLAGKKPEDLIGQNVWELFPDSVGSSTYEAFHLAIKEQRYICDTNHFSISDTWQESHIYPSPDGISVFFRDVTKQKKLETELQQQEHKSKMELVAVSLAAEEKERNTIGKELHDNVNQLLASTNLFLSVIRENPERATELIPYCIDTIKKAIQENRKIAHELVTPDLTSETLMKQVKYLFDTMFHPAGILTSITNHGLDEARLNKEQKLALYRILQEQCSNILKYAEASNVSFSFSTENGMAVMEVADDGKGTNLTDEKKGIGLKNISARLLVLEGEMKIVSSPGQGFSLKISLPFTQS